jgi:hypothetical protein
MNPILALVLTVTAVVTVGALRVASSFPAGSPNGPRIVLWGDSLAWEAQDAFVQTARDRGATVLVRTWGGTALCDWLDDIRAQAREWKPTVAVLSFTGNKLTPCMQGRDVLQAYREDVATAVRTLVSAGVRVDLVEAPPGPDQPVDADGTTGLDRIWRAVAAGSPAIRSVPAGRVVTDHGRWTATLPCRLDEPCDAGATATVRSPDGVHFCPVAPPPAGGCPVYSPGASRYGKAMAEAATEATINAAFEPAAEADI